MSGSQPQEQQQRSSYESHAEPIKLGYLFDFKLPDYYPQEMKDDLTRPFDLVFSEGLKQGLIDRPVEIIFREVEGLPKGTIKAVIDAYGELVDEGCLAIFGPAITDNCVPTREAIEERFHVPAISMTGTDDWLGEWTFSLPQGSMTDEPIFWAHLLKKAGHTEVGALIEQSLVGESYIRNFRKACNAQGIRIVAEASIAQTAQDVSSAVTKLYEAKPQAIVHCGFGFGIVMASPVLEALNWDPPRYMGTAFQNAWINPIMWNAILGWIGLDQYDEGNLVGQRFLDQYEAVYGRRPEYCVPVMNRDFATVLLHAFADAHPLTPRGVKEALERVKMLPAAGGAPGTRLSFGKWTRRGWMGAGYLVARRLDPDGVTTHLVDRFGAD
jgi:ABC-type branched-subunit amino acid transport system substrate-binding protein